MKAGAKVNHHDRWLEYPIDETTSPAIVGFLMANGSVAKSPDNEKYRFLR